MQLSQITGLAAAGLMLFSAPTALAWGDDGHKMVAWIAYARLTPAAKTQVDALLAADTDTHLTPADFGSRATWADHYRDEDQRKLHYTETENWHFVDLEIASPDLAAACFQFPKLPAGTLASNGAAKDCALDKIQEFQAELASPATSQAERIMALKFLMHFVGDIHQPLHASTNQGDAGANCEQVEVAADGPAFALHHYWDTEAVDDLVKKDPQTPARDKQAKRISDATLKKVAQEWGAQIAAGDAASWARGDAKAWVQESYGVSKSTAYNLPPHTACKIGDHPPVFALPDTYQAQAETTVKGQIQRAGVRLAAVINGALK